MSGPRILILASCGFLGIGLLAPTLTIEPSAGEFSWLVEIFAPEELATTTYSIFGAIRDLYLMNNIFLALVLGLFSIAFPIFKLSLYWLATDRHPNSDSVESLLKWTDRLSKFSMVEVLFLALLILTIKTLPGGSEAKIEWGAYAFVTSAIGSMLVPLLSERRKK
jgi:paraquat-inducible protein A